MIASSGKPEYDQEDGHYQVGRCDTHQQTGSGHAGDADQNQVAGADTVSQPSAGQLTNTVGQVISGAESTNLCFGEVKVGADKGQ